LANTIKAKAFPILYITPHHPVLPKVIWLPFKAALLITWSWSAFYSLISSYSLSVSFEGLLCFDQPNNKPSFIRVRVRRNGTLYGDDPKNKFFFVSFHHLIDYCTLGNLHNYQSQWRTAKTENFKHNLRDDLDGITLLYADKAFRH